MNIQTIGSQRPKLHLPKALLSRGYQEPRSPQLSDTELRRIVADVIG
ncbi:MAG TPA: hypothetical protein VLK25_04545 [Allosphingosinicella sp.]|nr:hypothetical protein [Allosphingosinicella sp.]